MSIKLVTTTAPAAAAVAATVASWRPTVHLAAKSQRTSNGSRRGIPPLPPANVVRRSARAPPSPLWCAHSYLPYPIHLAFGALAAASILHLAAGSSYSEDVARFPELENSGVISVSYNVAKTGTIPTECVRSTQSGQTPSPSHNPTGARTRPATPGSGASPTWKKSSWTTSS